MDTPDHGLVERRVTVAAGLRIPYADAGDLNAPGPGRRRGSPICADAQAGSLSLDSEPL